MSLLHRFMGNFVVKRSYNHFNQVPLDQATEWMNRMCKISNGIIGITRNDPARNLFCVTWAEHSHVSHETKVQKMLSQVIKRLMKKLMKKMNSTSWSNMLQLSEIPDLARGNTLPLCLSL